MKINKITSLMLKIIRKKERCIITELDNYFIITNGYIAFKIKKEEFELNSKLFAESKKLQEVFIQSEKENTEKVLFKYCLKQNKNFISKYSDNVKSIYINNDYIKYFDDECETFVDLKSIRLMIKEKGEIVGVIMPIRIEE